VLAIYSAHFKASAWANMELSAVVARQNSGRGTRVIAIRLDDSELPTLLQGNLYVDFRGDYETGLTALLRALGSTAAGQLAPHPGLSVDRSRLVAVLSGLDAVSLSHVVNLIPLAGAYDNPMQSPAMRVAAVLAFAEGAAGPGLNAVAAAVVRQFPHLKDRIGPFL